MIVEYKKSGIFFKLESEDFKYGATKEFLAAVKKIPGASYEPPEKPVGGHWWIVPTEQRTSFVLAKEKFIDAPVRCEKELRNPSNPALRDMAFRPIPKINYKFCRKRIV